MNGRPDTLLKLSSARLFAAKWTRRLEAQWISAPESNRPDLAGRLERRRDDMLLTVAYWEVDEAR